MSSTQVTVVDYGAGNLLNVVRALEHCGAVVEVTQSADRIAAAEKLILPGVGAFGDCMQALEQRGLVAALKDYAQSGRPFLGICVGMQVMFELGEEFGDHAGLGIIKGRVTRIPAIGADGDAHKIPHIGWSALKPTGQTWDGTIFSHVSAHTDPSVYFVHSFMGVPAEAADRFADVDYNGVAICAAIKRGHIYGCQFHPEKSGALGLEILRNFLKNA